MLACWRVWTGGQLQGGQLRLGANFAGVINMNFHFQLSREVVPAHHTLGALGVLDVGLLATLLRFSTAFGDGIPYFCGGTLDRRMRHKSIRGPPLPLPMGEPGAVLRTERLTLTIIRSPCVLKKTPPLKSPCGNFERIPICKKKQKKRFHFICGFNSTLAKYSDILTALKISKGLLPRRRLGAKHQPF